MRSVIHIAIFVLCFQLLGTSQNTFIRTYGGNDYEEGRVVKQCPDGGFIIAGSTGSFGNGNSDIYLLKIDTAGEHLWSKTIGGLGIETGYDLVITPDNGFAIVGFTNTVGNGSYDIYLVKTDSTGHTLWDKTYGGSDWDFAYSLSIASDGGFIITGETYSYGNGNNDVYLIKTDANGDSLWTKTYGSKENEYSRSVKTTNDGGYIVAGTTTNTTNGNEDIWMLKTDAQGDTLWTSTLGLDSTEIAHDVLQTFSGDYVIAGMTKSQTNWGDNAYFAKIDESGTVQWEKHYGGAGVEASNNIKQLADSSFVVLAYSSTYGSGSKDLYLMHIDTNGIKIFAPTFGSLGTDEGFSFVVIDTSDYLMVGTTNSDGNGLTDVLAIRATAAGLPANYPWIIYADSIQTEVIIRHSEEIRVRAFPNPSTGNFSFEFVTTPLAGNYFLSIYDIYGREIHQRISLQTKDEFILKNLARGTYVYKISGPQQFTQSGILEVR